MSNFLKMRQNLPKISPKHAFDNLAYLCKF